MIKSPGIQHTLFCKEMINTQDVLPQTFDILSLWTRAFQMTKFPGKYFFEVCEFLWVAQRKNIKVI